MATGRGDEYVDIHIDRLYRQTRHTDYTKTANNRHTDTETDDESAKEFSFTPTYRQKSPR